jgi:hypothetical protein
LIALAGKALDHGPRCTLLHKLKRISWQKLDFALADPQTSLRLREDEGDALEIPGRTPRSHRQFSEAFLAWSRDRHPTPHRLAFGSFAPPTAIVVLNGWSFPLIPLYPG